MVRHGNPVARTWHGDKRLRIQAQVYAEETHCWRCGLPVDIALREVDPRHPKAPSVDHKIAKKWRPDLVYERSNCTLAHYGCNSARGDGVTRMRKAKPRW